MANRVERLPALRELYREKSSQKIYRIVHVEKELSEMVLCFIFGTILFLKFISTTEFDVLIARDYSGEDGLIRIKDDADPYGVLQRSTRGTAGGDRQSETNWERIDSLVNDPKKLYQALRGGAPRTRLLQDIADTHKVTIQRIRKLFREYLQRGMNEAAVASEFWRCGLRVQPPRWQTGEDATSTIVSREFEGRPGRKPSNRNVHAPRTEALERLFEQCIDLYLTNEVGPWSLEISDEDREKIRQFAKDAQFPGTRKSKGHRNRRGHKARSSSGRSA
ncbi:hypothetical protein [Paraburkholderia terrae]|jgi:putative transposase|uniref:hypothetical protein n=1 Tax=Paraburkholderia terrae TaxID=311230 RepID=UPI001EE2AE1B|nr:hypothetical protein [Paraburkholderia terrae]GJH03944.1 hypothetical protein CBA19C8_25325 [Paraburkholderia terrae]